jgi:hypothetical protein
MRVELYDSQKPAGLSFEQPLRAQHAIKRAMTLLFKCGPMTSPRLAAADIVALTPGGCNRAARVRTATDFPARGGGRPTAGAAAGVRLHDAADVHDLIVYALPNALSVATKLRPAMRSDDRRISARRCENDPPRLTLSAPTPGVDSNRAVRTALA